MAQVLKSDASARTPVALGEFDRIRPLLLVTGAMLLAAGGLDVALLWYPPRLGETDWEFGIIAQSLDALPLPTMGLLLATLGVVLGRSRRAVWLACAACALVVLWLVAMALLFGLDVPQALAAVGRDARLGPGIKRVVFKAVVFFASYGSGYATLTALLWRRAKRMPA